MGAAPRRSLVRAHAQSIPGTVQVPAGRAYARAADRPLTCGIRPVPNLNLIKMCSTLNETLLRTLHAEASILTVYAKYVATPTKSKSQMAAKTLERKQQPAFR